MFSVLFCFMVLWVIIGVYIIRLFSSGNLIFLGRFLGMLVGKFKMLVV